MKSAHLVDPELLPVLDMFPVLEFSEAALPQLRSASNEMLKMQGPALSDPAVERREVFVPGPKGAPDVRVLLYTPAKATSPYSGYLHIHGGGYLVGAPDMSIEPCTAIARELGCVVASVDYRLAPETPFPGAIEDCYAALKWLHGNARDLGIDTGRIAIGGESAGGGLTAALALLARDRDEVPVKFQLLIYPMIDDRTSTRREPHPYAGEYIWTHSHNRFGWQALLGREPGSEDVSPYAAAARAEDLRGLPAAYISVGALDLFLEENLDYAARLMRAGVPTELHVYPGAFHGFEMATAAEIAKDATRNAFTALKRALRAAG